MKVSCYAQKSYLSAFLIYIFDIIVTDNQKKLLKRYIKNLVSIIH